MQPIDLLCEILAQKGKVAEASYSRHPSFSDLLAYGFLESAGVVQSAACMNCDAPHDAKIVHHGGRDGYFCPDIGFVPVSANEIGAVQANIAKVILTLANAFDCRARKSLPVSGATWRVGKVSIEAGDLAIYFLPELQTERDAKDLAMALSQEPGSTFRLVLSAIGTFPVAGAKTVTLSDVVELDPSGREFRSVVDLRVLVGVPRTNPGGAPNLYGKRLTDIIKRRIASGSALAGRNEEARAVLDEFKHSNSQEKPPSLSSVQNYVRRVRTGQ